MSSLLFCAGLVGGQVAALLTRTQSSVDDLRAATEQLRTNCVYPFCLPQLAEYLGCPPLANLPPFTIVGIVFFNLGSVLGVQQTLPLTHRLRVALVEITLFALSAVVVRVRIEEEDLLSLWVPTHVCGLVLGLLLALFAKGDLRSGAAGGLCGPGVDQRPGYLRLQKAELQIIQPPPRERANRQASTLIALLVALMVWPLAHKLAVLESQGAPVYSLASVL